MTVLVAQAASDATGSLLQYGAVGIVAVLALLAVRVLFTRLTAQLDRETARADRLEQELRALNAKVQEDFVPVLVDATRALASALPAREVQQ